MCTASMIGDHFKDKWYQGIPYDPNVPWMPMGTKPDQQEQVRLQLDALGIKFEQLKSEVLDMKKLLLRAIKYDKDHNEPDCAIEEKLEFLKKVADMVGIGWDDIKEAMKPKKPTPPPSRTIKEHKSGK